MSVLGVYPQHLGEHRLDPQNAHPGAERRGRIRIKPLVVSSKYQVSSKSVQRFRSCGGRD